MSRVVITGASGFVGRHLLSAFRASADVVGVTRRPDARGRLVCVTDYGDAPAGDVLVHLAEHNHRGDVQRMGEGYIAQATGLVDRLLARGFAHLVYVSSATVYGDASNHPHRVTDPVGAPDIYTRAKLACETRVAAAGGTIARFTNLYGPSMPADTVIATIVSQVQGDGPVRVRDDSPVRDFLWVDDAAAALVAMAERRRGGTYNVGSGVGHSVRDIARIALASAGHADREVIATEPGGRFSCTVVDISETRTDFGWTPGVPLEDGLARLVRSAPTLA